MNTETNRQAMHALIDMVVGFDEDASLDLNHFAYQTAAPRFAEIGAVSLLRDDDGSPPVVDVSPLLTAAGIIINNMASILADRLNADRLAVLATVRQHLDEHVFKED